MATMLRFSSRKALNQGFKCKIKLLTSNEELECSFGTTHNGQYLMDYVAKTIDLVDREYYGLKFANQIQWLDQTKLILKQTKGLDPIVFELRFKFYPAEPALLAQEMTRYLIYLQLRLDLLEGRLHCHSNDDLAYIIACILQSELGNHDPNKHIPNYVSNFKFVPNQTEELENTAARIHQSDDIRGLSSAETELNFLKKTAPLDTYGIDPYPVKEGHSQNHYIIGTNHTGILTFQDCKKMHHFKWSDIYKVTLDNTVLLIHCTRHDQGLKKKSNSMFGFKCPTRTSCHNLWKIVTEHRYFFTMESSDDVPAVTNAGGLAFFNKSCKLRYTGKVEKELLRFSNESPHRGASVKRSTSLVMRSSEPPRWSGFQQGSGGKFRPLSSLEESYGSMDEQEMTNMTLPASLEYKENSNHAESNEHRGSYTHDEKNSTAPILNRNSKRNSDRQRNSNRRIEKPKVQQSPTNSKKHNSDNMSTYEFIKTSFTVLVVLSVLVGIAFVMINEYDHPKLIAFRHEPPMLKLRSSYYLPIRQNLNQAFDNFFDLLDRTYY